MQRYLTTAEVADHYRTATSTVRYWRVIGYGPKCAKVGRQYLYPETAVQEFDEQLMTGPSTGAVPEYQSGTAAENDEAAGYQPAASVEQSAATAK